MKRLTPLPLLAVLAALLCMPAAARALTLSSEEGGYSITLPEDWRRFDPGSMPEGAAPMPGVSEKALREMKKNQQIAVSALSASGGGLTLAIMHASYEALGISGEEAKSVGRPGSALRERMLKETLAGYSAAKNMSAKEAPCPAAGYGAAFSMPLEKGAALYGLMHTRFTTTHVIFAACLYTGTDGSRQHETQQDILSRLVIDSDKSPLPAGQFTDSLSGQ